MNFLISRALIFDFLEFYDKIIEFDHKMFLWLLHFFYKLNLILIFHFIFKFNKRKSGIFAIAILVLGLTDFMNFMF